ncbi:uncharacterized protein [Diadema setosum]|uniref:uncharacterized protein n=1 Tax=Diadema setosum TaxID=31175 RepID=UPI003B3B1416
MEMFPKSLIHVPVPWELQKRARYVEPWVWATATSPASSPADLAETARKGPTPPVYLAGNLLLQRLQESLKNKLLREQIAALSSKVQLAEKKVMRAKRTANFIGGMASHSLKKATRAQEETRLADLMVRQAEDRACRAEERTRNAEKRVTAIQEEIRVAETNLRLIGEKVMIAEEIAARAQQRASSAEEKLAVAEEGTNIAEEKSRLAAERATRAEDRLIIAEENARQAEEKTIIAEEKARQAEEKTIIAEDRARQAEMKATMAEERARKAEEKTRRFMDKYLDATSQIEILKMELALAKPKKDPPRSHLQDLQTVVTVTSAAVSPSRSPSAS